MREQFSWPSSLPLISRWCQQVLCPIFACDRYTPPSSGSVSLPAQQSREKGLTESPQTPDNILGSKLPSTRSPWQPSNGRNPHTEPSALRSAPSLIQVLLSQ
ncbi:hypothetical protein BS47DRAFT_187902 [Hydnum rufescens UP504]|uniref:Uncharacterized protein n=1 Tax=Hydnum rufescens UP504 TaxID=1448309 RepID=A0A9P6AQ99_9AGAM|nr:hypothetical protein BS47DRAFT_187902 [Hydnum rufescens UP504]